MALLDEIRARKFKATVISLIVVLGTYILLFSLGVVSLTWAIVVGIFIYFRMVRTNMYAIWLRRFHRSEPRKLRFNMLLNNACPGLCIPITIQDSTFKTSYFYSGSRLLFFFPLIGGFAILLYIMSLVTISEILKKFNVDHDLITFVLAFVPIVLLAYILRIFMVRKGRLTLTVHNAIEKINSTMKKIGKRKLGFQGVLIFKCPDEVWQKVVTLVLSKANAVIIDVSDLTENVLWELKTSLEKIKPESVLLTFSVSAGASAELPHAIRTEIENVVGTSIFSRLRIFYYPSEQPSPGPSRGRVYSKLSKELQKELALCIENGLD